MTFKIFLTIFITVFLSELGDKTQLATVLFASNKGNSKIMVFFAAALALILATAIAVFLGEIMAKYVKPQTLSWIAGAGFIVIGFFTIFRG
ncbi:MAG: TMEM165/GDT1 family protein [Candidatus Omnitrophica bacterium]|nr:TMEM165/GDT1 family protein [Candidatus Omnitrophota bacterium]MDD5080398.1 TMEM165/GDT1 family protein [Candidatus Omnitrophota bacterium]MDD5440716.1 TMEM165/GDT1 family protein [Candidatus Omnitrophota bacterium]